MRSELQLVMILGIQILGCARIPYSSVTIMVTVMLKVSIYEQSINSTIDNVVAPDYYDSIDPCTTLIIWITLVPPVGLDIKQLSGTRDKT